MDQISSIIVAVCLMLIMIGMGLSLTINDFKKITSNPKALAIGLVNQMLLLPIVGYIIAVLLDLPPAIAIGLMILVACPGGATSNLITHLAKGDTALSISLTTVASFITIVSIPFIVGYGILHFSGVDQIVEVNKLSMILQLMFIILIPVSAGMLIRAKQEAIALKMDRPVRIASGLLLLIVTLSLIIKERANIIPFFQQAGIAVVLLNFITILLGWIASKLSGLKHRQRISIMIESGIQNSALAMTIATITLRNTEFAIVGAIYTLIMYGSAFLMILYGRKEARK